jgi:hypothetical protein
MAESSDFLSFVGGDPDATENVAIIVHGMISEPNEFDRFAKSLVANNHFDAVYAFDSWGYYGFVNQIMNFDLRLDDITDIVVLLKKIIKNFSYKDLVLKIGKLGAKRLAAIVESPPYVIEGAAQELSSAITNGPFENICLIGHSLGGIVSRCAFETFEGVSERLGSYISLGSPHRLWRESHRTNIWPELVDESVPYLNVIGNWDKVCARRELANFTINDEEFENIYKIIYPGHNHSSIHEYANESYIGEIISYFHQHGGFPDKDFAYHYEGEEDDYFCLAVEAGPAERGCLKIDDISGWLRFYDEDEFEEIYLTSFLGATLFFSVLSQREFAILFTIPPAMTFFFGSMN